MRNGGQRLSYSIEHSTTSKQHPHSLHQPSSLSRSPRLLPALSGRKSHAPLTIPHSSRSPAAPRSIPAQPPRTGGGGGGRSAGGSLLSPRGNSLTLGSLDSKLSQSFGERHNHFEQLAELEGGDMTLDRVRDGDEDEELLFSVPEESGQKEQQQSNGGDAQIITYSRAELLKYSRSGLVKRPEKMAGFELWFGEWTAMKSPTSARGEPRSAGGPMSRSNPTAGFADAANGEGSQQGRSFALGRGMANSGRPRNGLRRADLSPTNVKSPVDADGSHSYFSKKTKDGEDADGVQMGKFVVKSNLRIGLDDLQRGGQAISEGRPRKDGREPRERDGRGNRERDDREPRGSNHPQREGRDGRDRPPHETGWRRGEGAPAERERERGDKRWVHAPGAGEQRRGHEADKLPDWMGDGLEGSALEQAPTRGGFGAFGGSGMDEIAAYKMAMKEKERRAKGLEPEGQDHHHAGHTLSDPAIAHSSEAVSGSADHAAHHGPASFLLPAAKSRSTKETDTQPAGGRGSRFAKFFDPAATGPTDGQQHHQQQHAMASPMTSPPPVQGLDAHKQGLASLLGMGGDRGGRPAGPPDGLPAPTARLPDMTSPPPGLPVGGMLSPPSHGQGRPQQSPGGQPDEHMSRLLGMLKVATPSNSTSPNPPANYQGPDRSMSDAMYARDGRQGQHSPSASKGFPGEQNASHPPGLGGSMQGPPGLAFGPGRHADGQQDAPKHQSFAGQPHSSHERQMSGSQPPQHLAQSPHQGPPGMPGFSQAGMHTQHGGFEGLQNGPSQAAMQHQMLLRQMMGAGFNPAGSPPPGGPAMPPPGMMGMPFPFPQGGPPQGAGQMPFGMAPPGMPPQFGQGPPPFGMPPMSPPFNQGPPRPPGMGPTPQHMTQDLMAILSGMQGNQRPS